MTTRPVHTTPPWGWPVLIVTGGLCVAMTTIFVLGLTTGTVSIGGFSHELGSEVFDPISALLALVVPLMWAVPGIVVLLRSDWHSVGWMLIVCGIGFGLSFDLGTVALWDEFVPVTRPWAAWISDGWGQYVTFLGLVALLSVFPEGLGEPGSTFRKWKIARLGTTAGLLVLSALLTQSGGIEGNTFPDAYPNPTGLGFLSPETGNMIFLPMLMLLASSVWALRRQSRRASEDRHRQYTWVLFPLGLLAVSTAGAIALMPLLGDGMWLLVVLIYLAFPVAFTMAMVRYRWFDIDRLVSRTVTYGVVAAMLLAIYVVPVVVLPEVIGLSGNLAVAGATLLAAAAFNPVRVRVQRRVDRRFNRARYDAEQVLQRVTNSLQANVEQASLAAAVGGAVGATLHPRHVSVWLNEPAS